MRRSTQKLRKECMETQGVIFLLIKELYRKIVCVIGPSVQTGIMGAPGLWDCKDDFKTSDGLKEHWKVDQRHLGTYDFVCDLKFPNKQTCTEHVNVDPVKHYVCLQHQLFCGSQDTLFAHYFNSSGHAKCVSCKLGFETEQLRSQHYWASQSHPKCIKCSLGLRNASILKQHYLTSAVHVQCHSCKQGFNDSTDLEKHYWSSKQHASKCISCRLGFLSPTDLTEHFKTSPKHFYDKKCGLAFDAVELLREHYVEDKNHQYCKLCDISFNSSNQLKHHWTTAKKHRSTYCARCNTHVDNHNALIMHKVLSVRHYLCLRCFHDFLTAEKLKKHLETSAVHTPTFCKVCNTDFADNTELTEASNPISCTELFIDLQQHSEIHKPKPLHCFARCNSTTFDSASAVIEHLESCTCTKGWTSQHLNALFIDEPSTFAFINKEYVAYFLAGPPRHQALDTDCHGSVWKCYLCKKSMLSRGDLDRHLQAQDCHDRYHDNVLVCTYCKLGFDRISALVRHLDGGNCTADGKVMQNIVVALKELVAKDDGTAKILKVIQQLRIDATKGKELIVKVSMNST
ncbi:MAG: hypothetical protein Q9182_002462 [Xanthomendoza sp. 2 TL-2023]